MDPLVSSSPTAGEKRKEFSITQVPYCRDDLHTDGIEKLSAPGVGLNWMDWSFMMETCISASIYNYVMNGIVPNCPPPTYENDKSKICCVIARYVTQPNLVLLRQNQGNP